MAGLPMAEPFALIVVSNSLMPKITTASLVKLITDDGIMEMADHISLYKRYKINLDTISVKKGVNIRTGQLWEKELVKDIETGEWIPTELLEW